MAKPLMCTTVLPRVWKYGVKTMNYDLLGVKSVNPMYNHTTPIYWHIYSKKEFGSLHHLLYGLVPIFLYERNFFEIFPFSQHISKSHTMQPDVIFPKPGVWEPVPIV